MLVILTGNLYFGYKGFEASGLAALLNAVLMCCCGNNHTDMDFTGVIQSFTILSVYEINKRH